MAADDKSSVFVRNLPFDCTDASLEELEVDSKSIAFETTRALLKDIGWIIRFWPPYAMGEGKLFGTN